MQGFQPSTGKARAYAKAYGITAGACRHQKATSCDVKNCTAKPSHWTAAQLHIKQSRQKTRPAGVCTPRPRFASIYAASQTSLMKHADSSILRKIWYIANEIVVHDCSLRIYGTPVPVRCKKSCRRYLRIRTVWPACSNEFVQAEIFGMAAQTSPMVLRMLVNRASLLFSGNLKHSCN